MTHIRLVVLLVVLMKPAENRFLAVQFRLTTFAHTYLVWAITVPFVNKLSAVLNATYVPFGVTPHYHRFGSSSSSTANLRYRSSSSSSTNHRYGSSSSSSTNHRYGSSSSIFESGPRAVVE